MIYCQPTPLYLWSLVLNLMERFRNGCGGQSGLQTEHELTMSYLGKGELSYWQPYGRCKEQVMQLGPHRTAWMELAPSRADSNMLPWSVGILWVLDQALTLAHNDGLHAFLSS